MNQWKTLKTIAAAALLGMIAAGCATKGGAAVPAGADRVASGKGELTYKATDPGEAFVLDNEANKIVWSGLLRNGETLTIAPDDDRVSVGLQTVAEPELDNDHKYTVYLRRD